MASLVNFLSQVFETQQTAPAIQQPAIGTITSNSFSNNPFVNYNGHSYNSLTYAKNQPVKGGYFAGYYNGKQNIVGQRLFVEV